MIKEEPLQTTIHRAFCDVCGIEITYKYQDTPKCLFCNRDLCDEDIARTEQKKDSEGYSTSEPVYWCKKCLDLGQEYIDLHLKSNEELRTKWNEWKAKCEVNKIK